MSSAIPLPIFLLGEKTIHTSSISHHLKMSKLYILSRYRYMLNEHGIEDDGWMYSYSKKNNKLNNGINESLPKKNK